MPSTKYSYPHNGRREPALSSQAYTGEMPDRLPARALIRIALQAYGRVLQQDI